MVAGMGIGWYGHWGAGNGPLDGFFSGQALDRQNSQDRAHGPERGLGFDCCPDATRGGKAVAVHEK
jgi:hypothetical protein